MPRKRMPKIIRKFFEDKNGHIVLGQTPNVWLLAWVALTLISFVVVHGKYQDILRLMRDVLLGIWAILELAKGVNYFRRALGLVVLAFTIVNLISFLA